MENLNNVKIPKIDDRRVLLSSNDDSNNGENFRCAQSMNQVSCSSEDVWKMVELHKSDCLVGFSSSMSRHYGL